MRKDVDEMFGFSKRRPQAGWAEALMEGPVLTPEKYTPEFLEKLTDQQAGNDFRIIMDCAQIIRTTRNSQTREMRKRLAEEHYAHFLKLKPYFSKVQSKRFESVEQAMKEIKR